MNAADNLSYRDLSYFVGEVRKSVEVPLPSDLVLVSGDAGIYHFASGERSVWLNVWPDRPAAPDIDPALVLGDRINHRLPFDGGHLEALIPSWAALVFGLDTSSWAPPSPDWHVFEIGGWVLKAGASQGDFVNSMFFRPPGNQMFTFNLLTARRADDRVAYLCMLSTGDESSSDWRWFEHMRKPLLPGKPESDATYQLPAWASAKLDQLFAGEVKENDSLESVSVDDIIRIMSSGDLDERIQFIESCPDCDMKESAITAVKMSRPEMRPQALDFLAMKYAAEGPYDAAAKLGEATFRIARRMYQEDEGDRTALSMIAGRGALNWVAGLKQLGQQEEALGVVEEQIAWLAEIADTDNLDMLRLGRIELELTLERYDAAEAHLDEIDPEQLPAMGQISYRAHKEALRRRKGGGIELRSEYPEYTEGTLTELISGSDAKNSKPITAEKGRTYKGAAEALMSTVFGGRQGVRNEFTVRQVVIDAGYLFTDPKKGRDPAEIHKIVPGVIAARDWMKEHKFADGENDAHWVLYLAYSRTGRPGEAAQELQALHRNIERARSTIANPLERSRLSARFPFLYPSLAKMLFETADSEALFETIEASKGRVLADLQTELRGEPADDAEFPRALESLRPLLSPLGCTYLTYLVEEDATYAVVLTRNGELSAHRIELGEPQLARFAQWRDPRVWDTRDPDTLERVPNLPSAMSALVESLGRVMDDADTKHVCYSPSGPLLSIPLHCAKLKGRALIHRFSVSRIHGAASLYRLLSNKPMRPKSFLSFEVPAVQDQHNPEKMATWGKAAEWLEEHLEVGERVTGARADVPVLQRQNTRECVVHFSTHGTFPSIDTPGRDENPYRSSGVILSAQGNLPDLGTALQSTENLLTPERMVQLELNFAGSHVTLEACVTGLAKPSAGGDAVGLEFALLQLGAQSILSTHWNANVKSMSEFMALFYKYWLVDGNTRAEAWRRASLDVAESYQTGDEGAYHWAMFSLTGDWR